MSFRKSSLRPQRSRRLAPVAARVWQHRVLSHSIESLEERQLLSIDGLIAAGAVIEGFDGVANPNGQGVLIRNPQVTTSRLEISAAATPQAITRLSNNATGSGLWIQLSNLSTLKDIVIKDVTIAGNGSAGAVISLTNMVLDSLVIDRAKITGNGAAGLVLDLTNTSIKQLTIWDSTNDFSPTNIRNANSGASRISGNMFDGIHMLGANILIDKMRIAGNVVTNNAGTGIFVDTDRANIGELSLQDNEVRNNTRNAATPVSFASGSGIRFQTNRTNLGYVSSAITFNTITGNVQHGLSFLQESLLPGNIPTSAPSNFDVGLITDNTFNNNGGSGLSVDLRESTTWDAMVMRNTFASNGLRGFDLKGGDTVDAFNVQIGGLATSPTGVLVNRNTFTNNLGSAVAIELTDKSGLLGKSTGRFAILGNVMTGQRFQNGVFSGEGIRVRIRGDVSNQNGAARIYDSIIDRNTISANAGDGIKVNVSESSELINFLIGNATGRNQTFDVNGAIDGGGNVLTRLADGNEIRNNSGNGISIIRTDSGYVKQIRIIDNIVTDNNLEGIYLEASDSYENASGVPRPNAKIVNDFTVNTNDISNNLLNGVHLRTENNAVLLADMRYNRIDGNSWNGIRVTGVESNIADFENVGGRWIKNAITNNGVGLAANLIAAGHGNGIRIENVVGSVNPLIIGQDGLDLLDQQSLGNFIALNGEDGIEIGTRAGLVGTIIPRDIRDAVEIVNNQIANNGRNDFNAATPDPYTAGKGIDIELLASVVINRAGQTREFRIDRNVIDGNAGDGIEVNNRGGQLRLTAQGNTIDSNGGRGVDLLNQAATSGTDAEAYVRFGGPAAADRNQVTNNGLEGFYVVNTPAPNQTQDVNAEAPLATWDIGGSRLEAITTVNLVLDVDNNKITNNGRGIDDDPRSPGSTLSGTGVVLRVGSQYSAGDWDTVADLTGYANASSTAAAGGVGTNGFDVNRNGTVGRDYDPSANGRVNARIVNNDLSGNNGDDVFIEGYVALVPRTTGGEWNDQFFRNINPYDRDPLSRLNLEFHGNIGESLDVVRTSNSVDGQTVAYTNGEGDFKSRTNKTGPNPSGPFGNQAGRSRLVTRVADRGAGNAGLENAYNPAGSFFFFGQDYSGVGANYSGPTTGPNRNASLSSIAIATVDGSNFGGPIVVTVASRSGTVSDATNANPSVLTSDGHGLVTGDQITITGATGNTAINGTWNVQRLSANTFQLRDPMTNALVAGNGAYNGNTASWTLLGQHRLSTGDLVTISGTGVFNANGVHMIRVINPSSFELFVPTEVLLLQGFSSGRLVPVPGNGSVSTGGTVLQHNPGKFQYDGIGPSTLRVENNFSVSGFSDLAQSSYFGQEWSEGTSPIGVSWDRAATGTFSYLTASISDVSVVEGGTATLTVSLSEDAPVGGVSVSWSTSDGTAKSADGDFFATSGSVFIAAGTRTATINIGIADEGVFDAGEQFYVDLSSISTGDFVDTRGVVSIRQAPQITISSPEVTEGDTGGTRILTYTVTLVTDDPTQTISVDYTTSNGTATAGPDYVAKSGTITFGQGETTKTISIVVNGDLLVEGDETVLLTLSNATGGATLPAPTGTGTIIEDDTPSITIDDVTVTEGSGNAVFTVTLSKAVDSTVTVSFATANGTAFAGQDYTARSGMLTFLAGETSKQFTVVIANDNATEPVETFTVNLIGATNGSIDKAAGTATINDDDTPAVTIGTPVVETETDGTSNMVFTVTLSKAFTAPVTVSYSTSNGTATAGEDYVGVSDGTVTFAAGETSKTITIRIIGDRVIEPTERFNVNLTSAVNGNVTQGTATGVILDDDTPSITIDDVGVLESDGFAFFTVSLSKAVSSAVSVDYRTVSGTATSGVDFAATAGTLLFQPGQTTQTIFIQIAQDSQGEPIETFFVDLSMPVDATIGDSRGVGRIIDAAFATTLVVAPSTGSDPVVKVYGANPNVLRFPAFYAYDPSFKGGVRVALGDVNGDGVSDIVTSPATGIAPVRVFDGRSGALISSFFPYSPSFSGGLSIAADDLNGDGRAEIIVGLASNGSAIRVFNGANGVLIAGYYAFSPAFLGGVNVAVGDVTGDGRSDLIVGLASQGSAIRVLQPITGAILGAFYPFSPGFSGGVNVAVGDVNGDGRGEIIAGLASLGSAVRVFDTANLFAPSIVSAWQAFPGFSGGVSVGTTDLDFDGRAEVIVAPVAHSTPGTRFFNGLNGQSVASTNPFPEYNTGGWVGGDTIDLLGSPLRLDGSALASSNAAAVTQSQVDALTRAAIAKFAAAGASAATIAKLKNTRFEVGNLPGSYLGLSGAGVVVIDVNAGGLGWFVDSTPNLDEEFARDANGTYRAVTSQAKGKVDLLSVIVHELAHQLGFHDLNSGVAPNSLLAESLPVSVRRATKENVDDLFADGDLLSELLLA